MAELVSPYYRKAVLVAAGSRMSWLVVLKLMQVFSGYSAVILFSTSVFEDPLKPGSGRHATILLGGGNILAIILFAFLVDSIANQDI